MAEARTDCHREMDYEAKDLAEKEDSKGSGRACSGILDVERTPLCKMISSPRHENRSMGSHAKGDSVKVKH